MYTYGAAGNEAKRLVFLRRPRPAGKGRRTKGAASRHGTSASSARIRLSQGAIMVLVAGVEQVGSKMSPRVSRDLSAAQLILDSCDTVDIYCDTVDNHNYR